MKNSLKEQVRNLPLNPGVYLMKDKHGTIIYVGKAKKLRERVSSYFVKNKQHSKKTIRMIQQLTDFDVIEVDSELDALLLECQLIQEYRPIYNRQMNSFERYQYIEINTESEEVSIIIRTIPSIKNCFGPFSINRKLFELKQILENVYELNKKNYWQQSFSKNTASSFDQDIVASEILGAFTLNNQQPQNHLEAKMIAASENNSFEKALKFREEWQFLTRFFNQNKKLVLASQTDWQFLYIPIGSKIKCYLIHQGMIINSRKLTRQTFSKYKPSELARKMLPNNKPETITQFSKEQVDFITISYNYINRHKECQLLELADPFYEE